MRVSRELFETVWRLIGIAVELEGMRKMINALIEVTGELIQTGRLDNERLEHLKNKLIDILNEIEEAQEIVKKVCECE